MTKYAEAVERTLSLSQFLDDRAIPHPDTELTGNLGEWLVMDALIERGYEPTLHSGQADVDITLRDGTRIEVKTGVFDPKRRIYRHDSIQPDKLDYLVCVTFEEGYTEPRVYILDSEETGALPHKSQSVADDPDRGDYRIVRLYEDPSRPRAEKWKAISRQFPDYLRAWEKLPPAQ